MYGFLCPKTNVFYAIDSYETYQQILQLLSAQNYDSPEATAERQIAEELAEVNEAKQLADY